MTAVFVDTSALLAVLDAGDAAHPRAARAFARLSAQERPLRTSSYVLVELYALAARRFGADVARAFRDDFEPLLDTVWVDQELHARARDRWLERGRRRSSLVDFVSFEVMRRDRLTDAWAYDDDFQAEGFALV